MQSHKVVILSEAKDLPDQSVGRQRFFGLRPQNDGKVQIVLLTSLARNDGFVLVFVLLKTDVFAVKFLKHFARNRFLRFPKTNEAAV